MLFYNSVVYTACIYNSR